MYKNLNKKGWLYVEEISSRDISSWICINWGLGAVSAEEKSNTIKSFDYLKVDEQNVNSFAKLSDQEKKTSKLLWYYLSKMKMEIG